MTQVAGKAFVFDLHLVCAGYAYFTAYSQFARHSTTAPRREMRKPVQVKVSEFLEAMTTLANEVQLVENEVQYDSWFATRGWAIVPEPWAYTGMEHWLKTRECLSAPNGAYSDVAIVSESALTRSPSGRLKAEIRVRDSHKCLRCGATSNLTCHHIVPYSGGGETSIRNLAVLCTDCNQQLGTEVVTQYFHLIGTPHGPDLGLFGTKPSPGSVIWATTLTDNLMHTRCEL
jgi:hypothetical protein